MKNLYLNYIAIILITSFSTLQAQVGIGTVIPDGALDVVSANNGLLIPRVALTNTATVTVLTGTTSELVYNTATAGDVTPGFYYLSTNTGPWVRIVTGAVSNDWTTTGNAGTVAGTNFIGTTDGIDFRIKTAGADRFNISNTNGQLQSYGLGAAATPAYSFQGDQNTGLFSSAADQLDLSTNGTARFRIPAADQVHALSLGTAALPFYSFSADANTGILSPGADQLDFSTGGTSRFRIPAANQVHALSLGTAALPFYSFSADTNTGILSPGADQLSISTNGTEAVRVIANGNVGVNKAVPTEKLDVTGNIRLSGALMPNNLPGVASQVLISGGPGAPPIWTPFTTANNAATTIIAKYFASLNITGGAWNNNTRRTFIITDSDCRTSSAIAVNCTGGYSGPLHNGLIIENVVAEAGQFRVICFNSTGANIANGSTIPIGWIAFY
jgi:hypothetical protein